MGVLSLIGFSLILDLGVGSEWDRQLTFAKKKVKPKFASKTNKRAFWQSLEYQNCLHTWMKRIKRIQDFSSHISLSVLQYQLSKELEIFS